jgi:serralysin
MASSDILKLTNAANEQSSLFLYSTPIDATQGLSISFDFFSYGGTGGDGFGLLFVDGSQSPSQAGGFGGSLGYAPRTDKNKPGIAGGYLGVGFDEFGNFSNTTEGRIGGPGMTPDSIAVRGSQATGYNFLQGTKLPISLDNPGRQATREKSKRHAQIDLSPTGDLTVQVDLNSNNAFEANEKVIALNVISAGNLDLNGRPILPTSFKFGFAGSTGLLNNIHEVGDFKITTSDGTPLVGSFDGLVTIGSSDPKVPIVGKQTNDIIVTSPGTTVTGRGGADFFTFAGATKAAALKSSTVKQLTKVTDFNSAEGDRFRLDFDNNLNTVQLPKGVFNAGKIKAKNLTEAAKLAYADKDQKKRNSQALKANEAVFFKLGSRTYLSVDDNKAPFAPKSDLVADVTGIQFKTGDPQKGSLAVSNYFA